LIDRTGSSYSTYSDNRVQFTIDRQRLSDRWPWVCCADPFYRRQGLVSRSRGGIARLQHGESCRQDGDPCSFPRKDRLAHVFTTQVISRRPSDQIKELQAGRPSRYPAAARLEPFHHGGCGLCSQHATGAGDRAEPCAVNFSAGWAYGDAGPVSLGCRLSAAAYGSDRGNHHAGRVWGEGRGLGVELAGGQPCRAAVVVAGRLPLPGAVRHLRGERSGR